MRTLSLSRHGGPVVVSLLLFAFAASADETADLAKRYRKEAEEGKAAAQFNYGWCLDHGLRVVQLMTLMTMGLYNEPGGAYLPSVLY